MYRVAATLLSAVFIFGSGTHTRQQSKAASGPAASDMPASERQKLELRGGVFMDRKM